MKAISRGWEVIVWGGDFFFIFSILRGRIMEIFSSFRCFIFECLFFVYKGKNFFLGLKSGGMRGDCITCLLLRSVSRELLGEGDDVWRRHFLWGGFLLWFIWYKFGDSVFI